MRTRTQDFQLPDTNDLLQNELSSAHFLSQTLHCKVVNVEEGLQGGFRGWGPKDYVVTAGQKISCTRSAGPRPTEVTVTLSH